MTTTVYLIGVPGAGKSTALAGAIENLGWDAPELRTEPFAYSWYERPNAALLGKHRSQFPGTDTLALSVNPRAINFIQTTKASLVLGEGDRLANKKFLTAATTAGETVLINIDLPVTTAYQRMLDRANNLGVPPQKESWWNGRATKTHNLKQLTLPGLRHETVNGTQTTEQVAEQIADIIDYATPKTTRK
jgi:adenylate kinase family enzyme